MAAIPTYVSQGQQGSAPMPTAGAASFGVGDSLDLTGAYRAVENLTNTLQAKQERDDALWASKTEAEGRAYWSQQSLKAQQDAPEGASGFADTQKQQYEDWKQNIITNAPSDGARQRVDAHLTQLGGQLFAQNVGFEIKAGASQAINTLDSNIETRMQSIRTGAETYESAWAKFQSDFATLNKGLSAEQKSSYEGEVSDKFADAAITRAIDQNPTAVKAELAKKDGYWSDKINEEDVSSYEHYADQVQHNKEVDLRLKQSLADRATAKAQAAAADHLFGNLDPRSTTPLTMSDVFDALHSGRITAGSASHLMGAVEHAASGAQATSNAEAFTQAVLDIHSGKITSEDQLLPGLNKLYDYKQLGQLRKEVQDMRSPDTDNAIANRKNLFDVEIKHMLTGSDPLMRIRDPNGDQAFTNVYSQYAPQFDKAIASGVPFDVAAKEVRSAAAAARRSPTQFYNDLMQDNPGNLNVNAVEPPASGSGSTPTRKTVGGVTYEKGGDGQWRKVSAK